MYRICKDCTYKKVSAVYYNLLRFMKEGKLFEIRSKDVPMGAFAVVLLPAEVQGGDEIEMSKCAIAFEAQGNLAGDLIGQGVALKLVEEGGMVGVVLNPDEPASITGEELPDHVDDGF